MAIAEEMGKWWGGLHVGLGVRVRGRQDWSPGFWVWPNEDREKEMVPDREKLVEEQVWGGVKSRIRFSSRKVCDASWTFKWPCQGDIEFMKSGIQDKSQA